MAGESPDTAGRDRDREALPAVGEEHALERTRSTPAVVPSREKVSSSTSPSAEAADAAGGSGVACGGVAAGAEAGSAGAGSVGAEDASGEAGAGGGRDDAGEAGAADANATEAAETPEPREESFGGPRAGVDQPTGVLRLPKAAEAALGVSREASEGSGEAGPPGAGDRVAVDQPTSALRLPKEAGGKATERPSTFVPLKTDARPVASAASLVADTEQNPLDLLAELTNRPAPPLTPWRSVVRRIKIWSPLLILLLIVLAVVQVLRPLPEPRLALTAAESFTFDGVVPDAPWPSSGQAVLDVAGLGTFGSSGAQEPVPIASVAKVMTAYVILRDHPMAPDGDGADILVDQQAEDDAALSAEGESTVEARAGDTISQREALQAILIASGNNIARLLGRWDAGSEEAFVQKMNEAAADLGMKNTTYTDPSGLRAETVSTAADQVILGKAAMADEVFRQIVRMPSYVDSYGKEYGNWNFLVPSNGVVGIKTGTTTEAGGNLLFAAEQEVDGTTQLIVGAVLGQPPHPSDSSILTGALVASEQLIRFAQGRLEAHRVLSEGDVVGHVDDGLGGRTPVVVTETVRAVGWPGLTVGLSLEERRRGGVPGTADGGTRIGVLTVGHGPGRVEVPVALAEELDEPGFTDRLVRLG